MARKAELCPPGPLASANLTPLPGGVAPRRDFGLRAAHAESLPLSRVRETQASPRCGGNRLNEPISLVSG